MTRSATDVTLLIHRVGDGDEVARRDLWAVVYEELRRLASQQMSRERSEHTLQPTALVHEAWLRLSKGAADGFAGRAHFFGVAAEAMRRILVEHARRRGAERRGAGQPHQGELGLLDQVGTGIDLDDIESLTMIDAALSQLESHERHERKAAVVKQRFFVGMTIEQTAEVLGISPASVKRDWEFAKAWLSREMDRGKREHKSP
ncbi:MAG: RNA polymerase sigma factor (TIGR02999 family) [Pseudohongiellaceae bacterium]|jgi:RNA polymerase sigma factor (TIGR02999 family)